MFDGFTTSKLLRSIHTLNCLLCWAVGTALNALLIWLVVRRTPHNMRVYGRMLLLTCVLDICALAVVVVVQPVS